MSGLVTIGAEFGVSNVLIPAGGPKACPLLLDFTTEETIVIEGELSIARGVIEYVQGAYVNNAANDDYVIFTIGTTGQIVNFPPRSQGYVPFLAPNPPIINVSTTPGLKIPVHLYNVPMQACIWSVNELGIPSGGLAVDATIVAPLPVPVTLTSPEIGPQMFGPDGTDDGSFLLDGSSQELFAAQIADRYLIIQNPIGNNPVTVNLAGGDATASGIVLAAGGSYETIKGIYNAITVSGTNTETIQAFGGV